MYKVWLVALALAGAPLLLANGAQSAPFWSSAKVAAEAVDPVAVSCVRRRVCGPRGCVVRRVCGGRRWW
jgi:hypothetical protein